MFKSTEIAEKICRELLTAPRIDIRDLKKDGVPKHKGIYLWRERNSGKIVYVGAALGKRGLRQRIVAQHLNPNYAISRGGSVIRKAIVELEYVSPSEGCVDWMKENLLLSFWPPEEVEVEDVIFRLAEKILIAEERPRYNKEWKGEQEIRMRKRAK